MSVTIVFHTEPEGCWAEAPDVPGFSAAADDLPDLRSRVRAALDELLGPGTELDERFEPAMTGATQMSLGWDAGYTANRTSFRLRKDRLHPIAVPSAAPRP